jgi:hypothetical protein
MDVMCTMAGLPVCHPATGTCVQCIDEDQCGGTSPICDLARGSCTAFRGVPCAACNTDLDCMMGGHCTTRSDPTERVCLLECMDPADCPAGLTCDMAAMRCVPRIGSCTSYDAAVVQRMCMDDAECVTIDETAAAGACMTTCRHPCGTMDQCPPMTTCDGSFCNPM